MSQVQAILFPLDKYSATEAIEWLNSHNYKPIKKGHITENYRRYRIREPNKKNTSRTINFGKGIKAVVEFNNNVSFI
jgi:hypothetical protein